ncbi:MAG TPA: phosphotransferase [Roseiarcus sp.]|nr:phosphotransferase [Roseiarcus sp.]
MSRDQPILGRLLGAGKEAEAFEFGDRVVKLYRPSAPKDSAFREAGDMALAERAGLPTPEAFGVQRFDGRWGIVMSRVEGPSFADAIGNRPELASSYLRAMARLHLRVHPAIALAYVEQYADASGASVTEILSWAPVVAAARLAEGVEGEAAGLLEMALSN